MPYAVTLATKKDTIKRFVKAEVLAVKGMWAREMKLMNQLSPDYNDDIFWRKYNLEFQLNSLAWFKMPDGKARLDTDWTTYHFNFVVDKPAQTDDNSMMQPSLPLDLPAPRPKSISELLKS